MSLTIENVRYGNGEFTGYFAYPTKAKTPLPSVIVIQEAWGVDDHIEDVTRRFALAGYAALAPDVFARNGARPPPFERARLAEVKAFFDSLKPEEMGDQAKRDAALGKQPDALRARIQESMGAVFGSLRPLDKHLPPVAAAAAYLRGENAATRGQKVVSVGFCMGGGLSALLAGADPELAAAVICYGSPVPDEQMAKVTCPLLALYGEKDEHVNGSIAGFVESAKNHGKKLEHHVYPGAGHAFFNDTRPSYDVKATRDGFARILGLFDAVTA